MIVTNIKIVLTNIRIFVTNTRIYITNIKIFVTNKGLKSWLRQRMLGILNLSERQTNKFELLAKQSKCGNNIK